MAATYTPPTGSSVPFNFKNAYTPPSGSNVKFNFTDTEEGGGGTTPTFSRRRQILIGTF